MAVIGVGEKMFCAYSFFSLVRQVVKEHMPDEASTVFEKCINEKALVLSGKVYIIDMYW